MCSFPANKTRGCHLCSFVAEGMNSRMLFSKLSRKPQVAQLRNQPQAWSSLRALVEQDILTFDVAMSNVVCV